MSDERTLKEISKRSGISNAATTIVQKYVRDHKWHKKKRRKENIYTHSAIRSIMIVNLRGFKERCINKKNGLLWRRVQNTGR